MLTRLNNNELRDLQQLAIGNNRMYTPQELRRITRLIGRISPVMFMEAQPFMTDRKMLSYTEVSSRQLSQAPKQKARSLFKRK